MCKRLLFLIPFALMLVLLTNAQAQPTGTILIEYWNNMGGTNLENNFYNTARFPDDPDDYEILTLFDKPYNPPYGDNYAAQIRGYLYPPGTGDYTFWMACDDDGDLFLSTDDNPANKVKIAEINGWCPAYDFDNTGGTDNPNQVSAPIALEAGKKYYIEAAYKEGGGGDGFAAAWQGPGIPDRVIIDGAYLSPAAFTTSLLKASSPIPADGTIDADVAALEWTAGPTAVAHRVFLSTDDVVEMADMLGQTELTIQVATVEPGVTYWWRVDEVEADGTVIEGDVWTFSTLPLTAHFPSPADGAKNILTSELSWTGGKNAILHNVSFGTNPAMLLPVAMMQPGTTYNAGALEEGKTYYWRVDEFTPLGTVTGPVWSFSTPPVFEITDPNLIGYWKLDEGEGLTVVDSSGHSNHGLISGAANQQWVAGVDVPWMPGLSSFAMDFLGDNQGFVELPGDMPITAAKGTVMMWINTSQNDNEGMLLYAGPTGGDGYGGENEMHLNIDNVGSGQVDFFIEDDPSGGDKTVDYSNIGGTGWRHVAATWDLTDGLRLYVDGVEVDTDVHNGATYGFQTIRLGRPISTGNGNRFYDGLMDEVKLYDYALSADQIAPIGRDIALAYVPAPANGAGGVLPPATLEWLAGDGAVEHDVYLGINPDAVAAADATDTSGIYRGRQAATTYDAGILAWDQTYYWRIDEVAADATVTTGNVWSLSTVSSRLLENFESYDIVPIDPDPAGLVGHWLFDGNFDSVDGKGQTGIPNGAIGFEEDPVRGTVLDLPGGDNQFVDLGGVGISGTMPRTIAVWAKADNTNIPNWTLIFGFTGNAAGGGGNGSHFNIGSLGGPGGVGAHVWGWEETIFSDQQALEWHHYAMTYDGTTIRYYGDGVLMDTDTGKSNVRDLTASADRVHVGSRITQASSFPGNVDDARIYNYTLNPFEVAAVAEFVPTNLIGVTWVPAGSAVPSITLDAFAGTKAMSIQYDNAADPFVAEVSAVPSITDMTLGAGGISIRVKGDPANGAGPLYIALEDSAGASASVAVADTAVAQSSGWTEVVVALADFAGVDLTSVAKVTIGIGDGTAGGAGAIIVDQVRLVPAPPQLVAAFAFGSRLLDFATHNDPSVKYTIVHHTNVAAVQYDAARGFGYDVVYPTDSPFGSRGGYGIFGPFDNSANNRNEYPDGSPEQLYDSFIGAKDFSSEVSEATMGDKNTPSPNPEGIIFRADVPNGLYRFVAAFGEADNNHAHRILAEDGGSGPPASIGVNSVVLVSNHDQAQYDIGEAVNDALGNGVFARVGFDGLIPPPGDGVPPSPAFVNYDANGMPTSGAADSPVIEVTQGYIRIHQLQGNSNDGPGGSRDPNGGDIVILELWKL